MKGGVGTGERGMGEASSHGATDSAFKSLSPFTISCIEEAYRVRYSRKHKHSRRIALCRKKGSLR